MDRGSCKNAVKSGQERKDALCIKLYKNEGHLIKQPIAGRGLFNSTEQPFAEKAKQSRKKQPKGLQKSKSESIENPTEQPFAEKAEQSQKNSQKAFKKAKERAFESEAGKSLRSRKA